MATCSTQAVPTRLRANGPRSGQVASGPRGFTLIELMITVAIVSILAAIAIPSYFAYIARSNRSEVRLQLLEGAQWMERWRTEHGSYLDGVNAPALPAALQHSPATGTERYDITLVATASTYTLTATRDSAGSMANDECGNFTLTNTGLRGIASAATGKTAADCWVR